MSFQGVSPLSPRLTLGGRYLQTESPVVDHVPFRKQLKDEAKRRRAAEGDADNKKSKRDDERLKRWELTVGIEVHAQLNTEKKLFSGRWLVNLVSTQG